MCETVSGEKHKPDTAKGVRPVLVSERNAFSGPSSFHAGRLEHVLSIGADRVLVFESDALTFLLLLPSIDSITI